MDKEYSHLDKCMMNFTVKGRGRDVYKKLELSNEIKKRVTNLIANSKSEIYFFSVIEVGAEYRNPHNHVQLWHNDIDAIKKIYSKIIKEFSLVKKRCKLTLPDATSSKNKTYNYVLKDFSDNLTDNQVWDLEQTKMRMRKKVVIKDGLKQNLNIRFISKSKGKYTKELYRKVYKSFGVLRSLADKFLDTIGLFLTIDSKNKEYILHVNKSRKIYDKSCFISIYIIKSFEKVFMFTGLEILFYSPAQSPPFFVFILLLFIYFILKDFLFIAYYFAVVLFFILKLGVIALLCCVLSYYVYILKTKGFFLKKLYYLHLIDGKEYYCSDLLYYCVPNVIYKDGNRLGKRSSFEVHSSYIEIIHKIIKDIDDIDDESCFLSEDEINSIFNEKVNK